MTTQLTTGADREYGIAFAHRVPCPLCRAVTGKPCKAPDKPHAARRATAVNVARPPLDVECMTCRAPRGRSCKRVIGTHAARIVRASRKQLPTKPTQSASTTR